MTDKNLKIAFAGRRWYGVVGSGLYENIKKKYCPNLEAWFITSNDKESDKVYELLGRDDPNVHMWEVSSYFKAHWDEFTMESLKKYEEKYECAPVWRYIYTDRYLINRDHDYCVHIAAGLFQFFEELYANNNIDFYYDEAISTLHTYVAYIVGNHYGVKYISQMLARGAGVDREYHYYIDEPYQRDIELPENYLDLEYTEEELAKANDYLTEFEEKNMQPACMDRAVRDRPRLRWRMFKAPVLYFYLKFNKYNNDPYFYIFYHHEKDAWDEIRNYKNYKKTKDYAVAPDYSQKFVYFPLHFQPEASTLVCAPKYEKQLTFIDACAKSLPADTKLYIKEHPNMLGARAIGFYEELKSMPNVVLVDPWENSKELIKHCEAVMTLTGTVGFEAMLLRKPVFLFGNIIYETAPGVVKVDEMFENYLPLINEWKQPKRDDVVKYLAAYFRTLHPGNVNFFNTGSVFEGDNIEKLADSLWEVALSKKIR